MVTFRRMPIAKLFQCEMRLQLACPTLVKRSTSLLVFSFVLLSEHLPTTADEPGNPPIASSASQDVSLTSLPKPPSTIADLINRGNVKFVTGGEPQSDPTTLPTRARLVGETRFRFQYRYKSNARWRVFHDRSSYSSASNSETEKFVRVDVRFRSVKLEQSHEVWLRDLPGKDVFWKSKIVNHEFDHVRISSDPRIESMFRKRLKDAERFTVPYNSVANANGRVDESLIRQQVESKLQEVLAETTQFVAIRYRELDYVTRHGILPLPQDWEPIPKTDSSSRGSTSTSGTRAEPARQE